MIDKVKKLFTKPSFDIFLALSSGVGRNTQQDLLDSKLKQLKLKKKRLHQWAQLCVLGKIPEIQKRQLNCTAKSYHILKSEYDLASIGNASQIPIQVKQFQRYFINL